MTIDFEELAGSPRIQASQQGVVAVRSFRVAWQDWPALVRLLLGTGRVVGQATRLVRPPAFPGLRNLMVTDVAVEAFDPESPDGQGDVTLVGRTNGYAGGARLTVTYRTLFDENSQSRPGLPRVPEGTYLVFAAELGAEYLTVPGRVWHWNAPGDPAVPDDVNPGLLVPTGAYRLVWLRVPRPPWSAIRSLRGKVNQAEFIGAAAGTVLFLGAKATREFQFFDEGGFWRLEYSFVEQTKALAGGGQAGWNHFYKEQAVGGEHWIAIADASGNPPYASGDFAALFAFE